MRNKTVPKPVSQSVRRKRGALPQKRRRSSAEILARILRAATEEFKRNSYAGTTTAAIARNAGVTEAQLYRHFRSKTVLFREAIFKPIDQHLLDFVHKHRPERGQGMTAREMRLLYATELQCFIRENSQMLTSLLVAQAYESCDARGMSAINSLQTYFDHGATMMQARIKETPRVKPELSVRLTFAGVLGAIMFKDWIFPRGLADDDGITAAINDFVTEGLSLTYRDN